MASWVIVDKHTGQAVMETYNRKIAAAVNQERYEAVPIVQYLSQLNRTITEQSQ
jgi:hypothetical protein